MLQQLVRMRRPTAPIEIRRRSPRGEALHARADRNGDHVLLEPWWQSFPGPYLYYPGRRLVPAPLRAFIDFIKEAAADQ